MKKIKFAAHFPYNLNAARTIKVINDKGEVISVLSNGSTVELETESNELELRMWPYRAKLEVTDSVKFVNVTFKGTSMASHLLTSLRFKTYLTVSAVSEIDFGSFDNHNEQALVEANKPNLIFYLLPIFLVMYSGVIAEANEYRNLAFLFSLLALGRLVPLLFKRKIGFRSLNLSIFSTLILCATFIILLNVETVLSIGAIGLMTMAAIRLYVQGSLQLSNQKMDSIV